MSARAYLQIHYAARFVVSFVPSISYIILLPSIKALSCSCIGFLLVFCIRYSNIVAHSRRLCAAHSNANYLEVYSSDAGKGKTLVALANMLGVDIADVIAIGDSNNDSTMIENVGLGLAVANACDALKELADQTICDNSEHIAKYLLENYFN